VAPQHLRAARRRAARALPALSPLAGTRAAAPLAFGAAAAASPGASAWLAAAGGLLAAVAGAHFKGTLVLAAGHNQGFAIAHLPVRGTSS
jgi:phenylacetyl-CoA:acceptor oxidoreductase 26-kDa subunit